MMSDPNTVVRIEKRGEMKREHGTIWGEYEEGKLTTGEYPHIWREVKFILFKIANILPFYIGFILLVCKKYSCSLRHASSWRRGIYIFS